MPRYAEKTNVSISRSQEEISRTLARYGADQFVQGWDRNRAGIGFAIHGHHYRLSVPHPGPDQFKRTETGRPRNNEQVEQLVEQESRRRWRVLLLSIKAKLELIELGISSFEQEFLAHLLLPGGITVGERILPDLDRVASAGLPPLLPGPGVREM